MHEIGGMRVAKDPNHLNTVDMDLWGASESVECKLSLGYFGWLF